MSVRRSLAAVVAAVGLVLSGTSLAAAAQTERDLAAGNVTYTDVVTRHGQLKVTPELLRQARVTEAQAAGGCWYVYKFRRWTGYGITIGESWTQLNWCSNGSAVTSYYHSNTGGRSLGAMYQGYNGPWWMWASSAHREIRMAVSFEYNISQQTAFAGCMQLRGTYNGLYFDMGNTCNLR